MGSGSGENSSMAPSLGPQDEAAGYWSPRTSTIDWCEHNYVVSVYVPYWNRGYSNKGHSYGGFQLTEPSIERRTKISELSRI